MNKASVFLIGSHNFNAFRSADCQAKNPVRTLDSIEIKKEGDFIVIEVKAKSFLHNQVRIIVGTLKQIGIGKMDGNGPMNPKST
jgi:tRNA pseudouridine38-40 synthase